MSPFFIFLFYGGCITSPLHDRTLRIRGRDLGGIPGRPMRPSSFGKKWPSQLWCSGLGSEFKGQSSKKDWASAGGVKDAGTVGPTQGGDHPSDQRATCGRLAGDLRGPPAGGLHTAAVPLPLKTFGPTRLMRPAVFRALPPPSRGRPVPPRAPSPALGRAGTKVAEASGGSSASSVAALCFRALCFRGRRGRPPKGPGSKALPGVLLLGVPLTPLRAALRPRIRHRAQGRPRGRPRGSEGPVGDMGSGCGRRRQRRDSHPPKASAPFSDMREKPQLGVLREIH